MLKVIVESAELYDEESNTFTETRAFEFELEHSLLSLSKWEATHQKPFLSSKGLTDDEILDYVMCMIVTPGVLRQDVENAKGPIFEAVNEYINSPQSATTFGSMPEKRGPGEIITSELIYFWMLTFNIPFAECEKWHLNRLFSLIRIANIKNSKGPKMSQRELVQRNRDLNEKRKREMGTTG